MNQTNVLDAFIEGRSTRKSATRARRNKTEDKNQDNSVPKAVRNCSWCLPLDPSVVKRGKQSDQL